MVQSPAKTAVAFQASTSNASGATLTGSTQDYRTKFGGDLTLVITNGTAPTIGCDAIVETSNDSSTWTEVMRATCPTTASTTFYFPFTGGIQIGTMYIRTKFTGNTGQAVTCAAYGTSVDSIG